MKHNLFYGGNILFSLGKEGKKEIVLVMTETQTRLMRILQNILGFQMVEPLKKMPTVDSVDWTFFHPYVVDCYAEKYHPESNGNILLDKLVLDIRRSNTKNVLLPEYELQQTSIPTVGVGREKFLRSGFNTDYHTLKRGLVKKKELICAHYELPSNRYIILDESELLLLDDNEIVEKLSAILVS